MTGARQDMPGYDRYIASHDKYMACKYFFFLKCVFITFESSISCSSHVLCMLAHSNIRKLSPSMKTWWWHYSYVPVIYLHIPLYTVIWRYMRVYVGISGCQDSRHLESWPHGINVYIHVSSMYIQPMYSACWQRLTDMVYTKMKNHVHVSSMYIHFCNFMYTYVHCMYMVCTK